MRTSARVVLPARSGRSREPGAEQPVGGVLERVVIALQFGPGVLGAVLFPEGVEDGLDRGGGLGGQVRVKDAGAAEGGFQPQ